MCIYLNKPPRGTHKITPFFYDSISCRPFEKCLICETVIWGTGIPYLVEKYVRRNFYTQKFEALVEYALCQQCATDMLDSYSEGSKDAMMSLFEKYDKKNHNTPMVIEPADHKERVEQNLSKCYMLRKPVSQLKTLQVSAFFVNDTFDAQFDPIVLSEEVLLIVHSLLSDKTLDEIDDFYGNYLSGPPEWREFFKSPTRRRILM